MLILSLSSIVFASQLEFIQGKCKHSPVPNYISQTNLFDFQGEHPTAEEIQTANEKAIRRLVLPKCAGKSEKACLAIQGHTVCIISDLEGLEAAKVAISMVLSGSEHGSVYKYLESFRRRLH